MELSEKDYQQIKEHNFEISDIEKQLVDFRNGFPYAELVEPALPGKGILLMSDDEVKQNSLFFDENHKNCKIQKFVPASGAATRMFKDLYEYLANVNSIENDVFNSASASDQLLNFIENIYEFAFFDDLKNSMLRDNIDIFKCIEDGKIALVINYLLSDKGLCYGKLPKGLVKFHKYGNYSRTSVEEHIVEATKYAVNADSNAYLHFTVSEEHLEKFKEHATYLSVRYANLFNIKINIDFSIQKSNTDTIAVDMDNNPFRESDGRLLFRPGGHGALLENLNDIEGDIVFIKNIDNVVHDSLIDTTVLYKKALAGYLLYLRNLIYQYLEKLSSDSLTDDDYMTIASFAQANLQIKIPDGFKDWPIVAKSEFLNRRLNRPVRICGMVKNQGEPGGGPFWIKDSRGEITLQIVEASQVDMKNKIQADIFKTASHFNPVDIVCSLIDYKGIPFNLKKFVDYHTGFISVKSNDGRKLKAMELPGLWNGAMAEWITVFVEVPIETFNPVKTIIDLLRPQHKVSQV